jgi:hypothetical protein
MDGLTKCEHTGLRVIDYASHTVLYPYTPGARRGRGYITPEGEWVSVERRAQNRAKIEKARNKRAEYLIRESVKQAAANGGIFFTVTSAGVSGRLSGKIGRLIWHMRRKYGLLYYTWVRELTKSGLVHWHFAAVFTRRGMRLVNWLKQSETPGGPARIVELSNYWAALVGGQTHGNSIRLGWRYKNNRPGAYLLNFQAAGYLVKYLRKDWKDRPESEFRARRWQTNFDFLRPVRFDILKVTFFTGKKIFEFKPVHNDDIYWAHYKLNAIPPKHILNRDCDFFTGNGTYWAQVWRKDFRRYNINELEKRVKMPGYTGGYIYTFDRLPFELVQFSTN